MSTEVQFAIVRHSGKQVRVATGSRVVVDRLAGEKGDSVELAEVLYVGSTDGSVAGKVGSPLVAGASVKAKIVSHGRGPKVVVYRKNRRTGFTKKRGHRQDQTTLLIESISL